MTNVPLTRNFFFNSRGVTIADGGGVTWSFNQNTNTLQVASISGTGISPGSVANADLANMAANTIKGNATGSPAAPQDLDATTTKTLLSLNLVENTALSTWIGSANLTTVGTIASGTWQGTAIDNSHITGTLTGKTYNGLTLTAQTVGFTIAGGTTPETLTVGANANVSGTNTGDQTLPVGANPTGKVGSAAVNGVAASFMRSDAAPPIDLTASYVWTGTHAMSANPQTAATTRAVTGLAAFKSALSTASNNTLTSDAALTLTFNETGWYSFEIFLPFFEATSGAGGFAFNVLNGGTYGLGVLRAAVVGGFNTAAIANAAAITSPSTTISSATISTGSSVPSWYLVRGVLQVTSTGTAAVQWAQTATNVNATTLMAGAYVTAVKIG